MVYTGVGDKKLNSGTCGSDPGKNRTHPLVYKLNVILFEECSHRDSTPITEKGKLYICVCLSVYR